MSGIWVRSQGKKGLEFCTRFSIVDYYEEDGTYISGMFFVRSNGITLGTYKTSERAIEVLDIIEQSIQKRKDVFEMPLE